MSRTFPVLYKATASGGTQLWRVWVEETPEGHGVIHTQHGRQGGKLQEITEVIKEGKRIGHRNATTAVEQAESEAQSKWDKQRDRKHYGLTVDESAEKRGAAPMLAQSYEKQKNKVQWDTAFEQPKLDGFRCLADKVSGEILFWSREGKPFVLPHIAEVLLAVMQNGDRFDGELYTHGFKINKIASLVKDPREETSQLCYNVYDMPIEAPFGDRIAEVNRRLGRTRQVGNVLAVETVPVRDEATLLQLQSQRIDAGLEGSMLRYGNLPYQGGKRADCLLKVKTFVDGEFLITGVKEGRGTHAGMAIFQCVTAAGHAFDVLAPGSHEMKREALLMQHLWIGHHMTVKYAYMTSTEQPVPWHPVAKGLKENL